MNKKSKIFFISAGALIILTLVYLRASKTKTIGPDNNSSTQELISPSPTVALTEKKTIIQNQDQDRSSDPCKEKLKELSERFPLADLSRHKNSSERFHNRHIQIGNDIFRLRSFYDDANETEQITYIVYLEDDEEFAHIKERIPVKKGPLYLELEAKIKQGDASILYDEIAYTLASGKRRELFLQFIDRKLIRAQGTLDNNHLECTLQ